ncbi:MAG: hypothetical protein QF664_09725 [Dehalococcoidia bacterium]|jgi:hypothetical protein|nr:hypothetical protein [Dehalococcoidia bacterium]
MEGPGTEDGLGLTDRDAGPDEERPLLTLDLDGVICAPVFGLNLGIGRRMIDPAAVPPEAAVPPRWLSAPWDHVRFDLRRPLPGARAALKRLSARRRLVVLTGRRSDPGPWLHRHGMTGLLDGVVFNEGASRSAHFKLRRSAELGAAEHIDDDGPTAQLLAELGTARVYLRDWPRNRGLPYSATVNRVDDLGALAALLGADGGPGDGERPSGAD